MYTKLMIPVTVFTGYLGSGKTTIILNLIKQLDPKYKVVWLKNEYGNMSIDSELAHENNIAVKEMLNGCLCCVLVGKLHAALEEILQQFHPDRIIVESSGTAYPLPIVMEINKINQLQLDGVINVIDAANFSGYKDKGQVAKMQTECTDLIIINKIGLAEAHHLDEVLDDVYELNPSTPKIKTVDGNLDQSLLLGLDSKLLEQPELTFSEQWDHQHNEHNEHHDHDHPDEVDTIEFETEGEIDRTQLEEILQDLKRRGFIRIKGVVLSDSKHYLLNWVYGRTTWQALQNYSGKTKIVFMGQGIESYRKNLLQSLDMLISTTDQ